MWRNFLGLTNAIFISDAWPWLLDCGFDMVASSRKVVLTPPEPYDIYVHIYDDIYIYIFDSNGAKNRKKYIGLLSNWDILTYKTRTSNPDQRELGADAKCCKGRQLWLLHINISKHLSLALCTVLACQRLQNSVARIPVYRATHLWWIRLGQLCSRRTKIPNNR